MSAAPSRLTLLFGIDLRSLAAMRIVIGLTMLWVCLIWSLDLGAFFTDAGILPRDQVAHFDTKGRLSLLMLTGAWWWAAVLWFILVIAAMCLVLGVRSRLAAAICWIIYLSFTGRNPLLVQGGDTLIPLLLFWMMFLPIGAVFSVDAALDPVDRRQDPPHLSVASVGLLLQVLYVYVFGALLKTSPVWFPNASAVYLALHLDVFVTPLGEVLRLFPLIMAGLTLFVYAIELFAPVLLFFPDKRLIIRSITLGLLVMMHFGFRIFIHIGHFWMASLSSLCAYIPSSFWNWIARRYWRRGQGEIRIYYDRDCGFCLKTALILREFFLPRSVTVTPAQDDPVIGPILEREVSWVVVTPTGEQLLHWRAVVFVMRQSPLLTPFGWLAALYGAIGLGRVTYDLIGRNRRLFGTLTAWISSPRSHGPQSRILASALSVVIVFCFVWNVIVTSPTWREDNPLPQPIATLGDRLGLTQYWTMFAPSPPAADGFPILVATTPAGEEDAFRGVGVPVSYEPPADALGLFETHRWRAFFIRAAAEEQPLKGELYERWAAQVCTALNAVRPPQNRIEAIKIQFFKSLTLGGYREEYEVIDIGQVDCT